MEKKIGYYSFVIGVVLAIVLGLALPLGEAITHWLTSLLVVLGLVVGFINITDKETTQFLTVATILVIVAFAGGTAYQGLANVDYVGRYIVGILNGLLSFVVPAIVVVALKDIIAIAKEA